MSNVSEKASAIEKEIISWRRHLHAHPELSCKEYETTEYIAERLSEMGIPFERFEGCTGGVAVIRGDRPGKTVMLRADIDALPIIEDSGVEFPSQNNGVMHACGHDCHTAMLLGAASILKDMKNEINGTVKLIFQMGEEIGRKSGEYVKRGALLGVDAIFGMHVWPTMDTGYANFEEGERMACSDRFTIRITGKSSHGSAPHLGQDAVLAAAACVLALQKIPSREKDPLDTCVLTVGMMNGGTKQNIIAAEVELVGTVRVFNKAFRDSMPERISKICENVAAGYGCTAGCDYYFGPSPLINEDKGLVKIAQEAAKKELGENSLIPVQKMTGAEDFSVYLESVPGVYGYIGIRNEAKGICCSNHHPAFVVDEDALRHGTAIYVNFALDYLNS